MVKKIYIVHQIKNWSWIDLTLIDKKLQKVHVDYVDPNIKCQILVILSSQ